MAEFKKRQISLQCILFSKTISVKDQIKVLNFYITNVVGFAEIKNKNGLMFSFIDIKLNSIVGDPKHIFTLLSSIINKTC